MLSSASFILIRAIMINAKLRGANFLLYFVLIMHYCSCSSLNCQESPHPLCSGYELKCCCNAHMTLLIVSDSYQTFSFGMDWLVILTLDFFQRNMRNNSHSLSFFISFLALVRFRSFRTFFLFAFWRLVSKNGFCLFLDL